MRQRIAMVVVVPMLLLAACGGDDGGTGGGNGTPATNSVIVTLSAQNNSGITGTATMTEAGGSTRVVVTLTGAGTGPQPIHIHPGTCAQLNPKPEHTLTPVANGRSETTVNATLASVRGGKFAINVHKSPTEAAIYVACGDIA